jgi:hypothetical protein
MASVPSRADFCGRRFFPAEGRSILVGKMAITQKVMAGFERAFTP